MRFAKKRTGSNIAIGRIFRPVIPLLKLPSYRGRMWKELELGPIGNFIFGPVIW